MVLARLRKQGAGPLVACQRRTVVSGPYAALLPRRYSGRGPLPAAKRHRQPMAGQSRSRGSCSVGCSRVVPLSFDLRFVCAFLHSVRYHICKNDILKANEQISMQISAIGTRSEGTK